MEIKIEIDEVCTESEVTIRTSCMTEEIHELIQRLSSAKQNLLAGFLDDMVYFLDPKDIVRFYALEQKVFAQTLEGEFVIRLRLYELEGRLDQKLFLRISNSEIVNLKHIAKLDLSFSGTICMTLTNGENVFASRRNVAHIKRILGI